MHNADNKQFMHSPTTSPYGYSSFLKEESLVAFDTFTFAVLNITTKYKCIFEK